MGEWRRIPLGDVAKEVTVGHVGSMAGEYRKTGIPFLRSQNVLPHRVDLSDVKFIDESFHGKLKKSALAPGDVITVRTGKPGTSAVVPDWIEVANCADLAIIRPGPSLDARWLSYYLNFATDSDIAQHLVGAVQQHFNVRSAKALVLSLPDLDEQRAIADILGSLDDKIRLNRHVAELGYALQWELWRRTAKGSEQVPLVNLAPPHLGGTPSRSDERLWAGDIPWASVRDMSAADGGVLLTTAETISSAVSRSVGRLAPLPERSVALTARGTVGKVVTLGVASAVNQSAYGFIPPSGRGVALRCALESIADELKARAHGSVFSTITMSTLEAAFVPAINEPEWDEVCVTLELIEDRRIAALREIQVLARTRDELLPLLMSGRIRIIDAEARVSEVV